MWGLVTKAATGGGYIHTWNEGWEVMEITCDEFVEVEEGMVKDAEDGEAERETEVAANIEVLDLYEWGDY